MTIKHNEKFAEWIITQDSHNYRCYKFDGKYILEEIEWPCNDLSYISTYNTLEEALIAIYGGSDND